MVFFSRSNSLTEPFRIYRHDLRTGYERNLTAPTSSGRGDYSFALSPDGKQLAVIRNLLWQSTSIQIKNLEDGSSRALVELPYLLERVDWLNDEVLVYRGENWQLVSHHITTDERQTLADVGDRFSFVVTSQSRVFAYKGRTFDSAMWSLDTEVSGDKAMQQLVQSQYVDRSPIKGSGDDLYFISNRSGKTQLWKKQQDSYSPLTQIELPREVKNLHFSEQHNAFYGVSAKRIFRIDATSGNLVWLSNHNSQICNVTLSDDGKLIYAEDKNEQWVLKSLDLNTLVVTDLAINGFGAHQVDDNIYYTRYREPGLWRYNINQGEAELLIAGFDAPLPDYWDVYEGKIYLTGEGRLNVYAQSDGQLLDDSVKIAGFVRNIRCVGRRLGCVLGINQPGETEILIRCGFFMFCAVRYCK